MGPRAGAAGPRRQPAACGRGRRVSGIRAHATVLRPTTVPARSMQITECLKPALADGTPVHREPLRSRYTKPRTVQRDR
ncbi:DUF402 domain-containing protein, partial [Streptomyces sp. NPDC003832]